MEKKHSKAPLFIGMSIVAVLAVVIAVIIIARSNSPKNQLQDQLDLGYRYLEELNYEQAIAAFEAAIEIDPKRIDGYLGLVEAYAGCDDASNMLDIYEMAEANLSSDEADAVKQNIIDSIVLMMENAHNDGNDNLVESFLIILEEIDPDNIEEYRQQYASIIVTDADLDVQDSDSISNTDAYLVRTDRVSGDSTGYMLYEYSGDEYTVNYYDSDGVIRLSVRYNKYGDPVYMALGTDYDTGMAVTTAEYEYDDAGRSICSTGTNASYRDGEIFYQNTTFGTYEYDSHGNYIMHYDDGRVRRVEVDDVGNEIYLEITDAAGNVVSIENNVYDSRGNVVMTETGDGERSYYTNTYSDGVVLTYDNP